MSKKNILKKWGAYALGIMAITGGMVATNIITNNSVQVSASTPDLFVVGHSDMSSLSEKEIVMANANGNYNALYVDVAMHVGAGSVSGYKDKYFVVDGVDENFDLSKIKYEDIISGINYLDGTQGTINQYGVLNLHFVFLNSATYNKNHDISHFTTENFNVKNIWNMLNIILENEYELSDDFVLGGSNQINYQRFSNATIKYNSNGTKDIERSESYPAFQFNINVNGVHSEDTRYLKVEQHNLEHLLTDSFTQKDIDDAFVAGAESVDITSDNESVINQYITDNNMKTESEYNSYGESQYQAGAESVDITSDNDGAINQYITDNNMKTEEEYNSYGESQYQAGTESVDITSDNEQSYNSGFQDAMDSFGKTEDSEGKYMYMFEMADRHGSVERKSIIINEEQGKSNVLKTTLFLNINNNNGAVNHYDDSSYLINVDEILDFDNLRYSDIVRYGDKIVEDTGYVFSYSDVIFYSPSGKLVSFINNVDLENLSKQIMELIKVNELAELNEDMTNMRVNFSHTALDYFGNFVSIEQNYEGQEFVNVSNNGSIGIHVNSGRNLDFSVMRRSYDDVMYGVYGNGYSHDQYLEYGEEQFNAGAESVDITSDNESAINQYITDNNMKTEEEYNAYGEEQFNAGKEENANEYADRLNELDMTINNLNREIDNLNSKINDYETTDDKYQLGYENGRVDGELIGFNRGFEEALSKDLQTYGEEQFNKGYNSGLSIGFSNGYNQAQQEKDEEIGNIEQEKEDLVGQVESLQNDITGLNNRINELTGTINNMNGLLDKKYDEGFVAGAESVDITSDNEQIYQQGYFDGYTQCEIDNPPSVTYPENTYEFGFMEGYDAGLREGRESVDITIDNESAINQYITDNNMKTEEEYKNYGTSQYKAGAESVDITLDNESAVSKYLSDNNMKTEEEYNAYGEEKYSLGYKDNSFGKQVKRLGSSVGTFFINLGKGVVQYVAFGWLWDKSGRFSPAF